MTATEVPAATFTSLDPRTDEVVGTHPLHDVGAVDAAVARAVEAAAWWSDLGFDGRAQRLLAWKKVLVRELDRLAETIVEETGKPLDDAKLELALSIEHLDWATRHAEKTLGVRTVAAGALMANQAATPRSASSG